MGVTNGYMTVFVWVQVVIEKWYPMPACYIYEARGTKQSCQNPNDQKLTMLLANHSCCLK